MNKLEAGRSIRASIKFSLPLFGIVVLLTAGVSAQRRGRNWDGYPNLGGSYQLRQTALNAGYNEGSKEGRKDRDKRRYSNYGDFGSYRDASKDYSSKLGDKDLYRRYFRMAFESGYDTENPKPYGIGNPNNNYGRNPNDNYGRPPNDNYGRNPNDNYNPGDHWGRDWEKYPSYGGSYELRQTALNAGYNEGIKQGRNDGKKGRSRNPSDFSQYRDATTDYSSKLGDRETYRQYYRKGFENGYNDGFRGY